MDELGSAWLWGIDDAGAVCSIPAEDLQYRFSGLERMGFDHPVVPDTFNSCGSSQVYCDCPKQEKSKVAVVYNK